MHNCASANSGFVLLRINQRWEPWSRGNLVSRPSCPPVVLEPYLPSFCLRSFPHLFSHHFAPHHPCILSLFILSPSSCLPSSRLPWLCLPSSSLSSLSSSLSPASLHFVSHLPFILYVEVLFPFILSPILLYPNILFPIISSSCRPSSKFCLRPSCLTFSLYHVFLRRVSYHVVSHSYLLLSSLHPQKQKTLGFNLWKQSGGQNSLGPNLWLCAGFPMISPFVLFPIITSLSCLPLCVHLVFLHLVSRHPFMLSPFIWFPFAMSPLRLSPIIISRYVSHHVFILSTITLSFCLVSSLHLVFLHLALLSFSSSLRLVSHLLSPSSLCFPSFSSCFSLSLYLVPHHIVVTRVFDQVARGEWCEMSSVMNGVSHTV